MSKFISFFLILNLVTFAAQANVSLSKFRLYFDNNNRNDALQLRNKGSKPVRYSVELGLVAMTEEGALHPVDSDPFSAIGLLRYSPKRGVIQPGDRQALRFSLRKPAGLKDGEYRAVLKVTSSEIADAGSTVALQSKLAYNLPIIVRHGRLNAETSLQEAKLVRVGNVAHVEFWQTLDGNRSLFGNFILEDEDGNEVGVLNNSAVYQPLDRKKVIIPLQSEVQGNVTIKFKEIAKYGGDLAAETNITLN